MASAKLYVSTNVVDRLTKPLASGENVKAGQYSKSKGGNDDPSMLQTFDESFDGTGSRGSSQVINAATFIGSLQTGIRRSSSGSNLHLFSTPSHGNVNNENDSSSVNSANRATKRASGKVTTKSFENFLERQKIVVKKREENVKHVSLENQSFFVSLLLCSCCYLFFL
jgi:hypothetical protein